MTSLAKCSLRALGLSLALLPALAAAEVLEGVQLPENSRKVAEHRYRAPSGYEETLKYYRAVYPPATYPRRFIANQPGIKAIHIVNPSGRGFQGLNIYEANDEVRIYIVQETEVPKPERKVGEKKTGSKKSLSEKHRRR